MFCHVTLHSFSDVLTGITVFLKERIFWFLLPILPAYKDTVGFENERGAIGIEGKHRSILVILIAGILARRVVSWKNLGDTVKKGELYGMIKFGSCTEIYIPGDVDICVREGDVLRGGLSVIGRLK